MRPLEIVDICHDGCDLSYVLLVDGERVPVWYRSSVPLSVERADAFVPVGLLAAMRTGMPLVLPRPISPRLLDNLPTVQDIIHAFSGGELRVTTVVGEPATAVPAAAGRGVGTFFGGGVDAFYTALQHREELTHLVNLRRFDVFEPDSPRGIAATRNAREVAAALDAQLVEVETNARDVCHRFGTRSIAWTPAMVSVALLLQDELERIEIPASDYYGSLVPWGSHPLLDPLWGTEALEIDHDGCEATRSRKVVEIAGSDLALQHLRVCNQQRAEWNCGRCEKCLRTMTTLHLAGALGRCATLPDRLDVRALARLRMAYDHNRTYTRENRRLAYEVRDWPVLAALVWSLRPRPLLRAKRRADALIRRASTRTGG